MCVLPAQLLWIYVLFVAETVTISRLFSQWTMQKLYLLSQSGINRNRGEKK